MSFIANLLTSKLYEYSVFYDKVYSYPNPKPHQYLIIDQLDQIFVQILKPRIDTNLT